MSSEGRELRWKWEEAAERRRRLGESGRGNLISREAEGSDNDNLDGVLVRLVFFISCGFCRRWLPTALTYNTEDRRRKRKRTLVRMSEELQNASELERRYVHQVYTQIAPHFNHTRYKAWPKVRQFLWGLPKNSIVADVGKLFT